MLWLCASNPHVTSLNMSWESVLQLPVGRRNRLIEKLEELQHAEVQASKGVRRR
jgi:hypothetical protein